MYSLHFTTEYSNLIMHGPPLISFLKRPIYTYTLHTQDPIYTTNISMHPGIKFFAGLELITSFFYSLKKTQTAENCSSIVCHDTANNREQWTRELLLSKLVHLWLFCLTYWWISKCVLVCVFVSVWTLNRYIYIVGLCLAWVNMLMRKVHLSTIAKPYIPFHTMHNLLKRISKRVKWDN